MMMPLSAYSWIFSMILIMTMVIMLSLSSSLGRSRNSLMVMEVLNLLPVEEAPLTLEDWLRIYYDSSTLELLSPRTPDLLILRFSYTVSCAY